MSAMTSLSLFIAPIGFGQAVSGVLFFEQHLPLVLGDELAVFVVVEAGDALAVGWRLGRGCLQVVSVNGFLDFVVAVAGEGVD